MVTGPVNPSHFICMPSLQHDFIILLYRKETEAWGDEADLGKKHGRIRIQNPDLLDSKTIPRPGLLTFFVLFRICHILFATQEIT